MGQIFYSAGVGGFLDDTIHALPDDAVQISADVYAAMLAGQSDGKVIMAGEDGGPMLSDPVPVEPAVPEVVSRFQARQALRQNDLLDAAEAAIAQASQLTQDAWADTTEWRRDSPTIATMADALGLSSDQVDDLFRLAATITA